MLAQIHARHPAEFPSLLPIRYPVDPLPTAYLHLRNTRSVFSSRQRRLHEKSIGSG
jgi:hypothetical protein